MEAPKRRTATYETFDTGVSTVTFENDGYGETSDTRFTITKGGATIAAIERAKSGPNYDLIIYDSALHEIKRQTLTSQYSASAIQWVGVRDGKLIISEDNCK